MTQAIQLGTVLGGRYKVTAQVVSTAARDQVLEGRDQVLGRRVSILAASPAHSELLIENARTVASGPRSGNLQILDLGQSEETTYLITSHTAANELLDLLLTGGGEAEEQNEGLGSEIFGGEDAVTGPESGYVDVTTDTSPQQALGAGEAESGDLPAVTRWTDADYESFGEEPPVQRSSRASDSRGSGSRGTLFDRAASDAAGPAAAATAASLRSEDGSYDGDNSYRYEGDRARDAGPEGTRQGEPDHFGEGPEDRAEPEWDEEEWEEDPEDDQYYDAEAFDTDEEPRRRGPGAGLWITALVIAVILGGLVYFGFTSLGALVSGSGQPEPAGTVASAATDGGNSSSSSASASSSPSASGAAPEAVAASRIVTGGDSSFMADQDGTLSQVVDGNPATVWSSYGFSSAQFGSLISGFGIAVELKDPAQVSRVVIDQQGGSGGSFTVYTAGSPSLDGATEAGQGTFQGTETTVDLSQKAASQKAQYVIVYFDAAPQLSQPIGGYSYGVRLGEIAVK